MYRFTYFRSKMDLQSPFRLGTTKKIEYTPPPPLVFRNRLHGLYVDQMPDRLSYDQAFAMPGCWGLKEAVWWEGSEFYGISS